MSGAFRFDPWAALEMQIESGPPPNPPNPPNRDGADGPGLGGLDALGAPIPSESQIEALVRATAERVRSGLAGYPADDAERGEREAIEAEGRGELAGRAPDTARSRAPEPEVARHLASLGPTVTAAFTSRPDGRVEVRHRRPDGTWSAPTILPARGAAGRAA